MSRKSDLPHIFNILLLLFTLNACCDESQEIPPPFGEYITTISDPVEYMEIIPYYGKDRKEIPAFISKTQALEDIRMVEYLFTTSYAGFEYWRHRGVDFESYYSSLREFVGEKDSIDVHEFEDRLIALFKEIRDGHIAIIGWRYNLAYRHKGAYFCDILVEETDDGLYRVIDSEVNGVEIGDRFTQKENENLLFRTLSAVGKNQYLIGTLSFDAVFSLNLSFNKKRVRVPFHKSRLLYAKFSNSEPFYLEREKDIPIVRAAGFGDNLFPDMMRFVASGLQLRNEKRIILNVLNNGGGSSVFPNSFLKNLNGQSSWELCTAMLTTPAVTQYFANYDLSSNTVLSPTFRNLILTTGRENDQYRISPARNWKFSVSHTPQSEGTYDGTLIILTNRRVLSAGEGIVLASKSVKNRLVIGENTAGVGLFSDGLDYYLPNSKIILKLPRQMLSIPGFEECVGLYPDYWLESMEPVQEVVRWLDNPQHYQFRFSGGYEDMIKAQNLAPVLPDDTNILPPDSKVPKTLRAFSGKWFGVSDGILDHLLVVEKIDADLNVDAIYSWGVAFSWNINKPGWQRFKGKFQGQKLILADEDKKIKIVYRLNEYGNLEAVYERPGIISYTTLIRIQ